MFNVLPWRRQVIIGSLLQCDYIGFHIPRQVENCVDAARGVMPLQTISRQNCARALSPMAAPWAWSA